jgi:hypothetical protein
MKRKAALPLVGLGALLVATACGDKPKIFDTNVEIARIRPIRRDEKTNQILTLDVEVSFVDCPGEQKKMIRGDKAFAECLYSASGESPKHKVGDKVPVKIAFGPRADGSGYENKLVKVAECTRKPDPKDEASYEVVQDCEPLVVNGVDVGVHCDRKRNRELLHKCPWFRVH